MISLLVTVPVESSRMLCLLDFLESNASSAISLFLSSDAARIALTTPTTSLEESLTLQKRLQEWACSKNYRIPVCRSALKTININFQLATGFEASELGQWVEDSVKANHVLHWGSV